MMHKILLAAGAIALVGMSSVAVADGQRGYAAPTAAYNWSGVYFGSHLGYGWSDVDLSETVGITFGGTTLPALQSSHSADGWIGGVHLGAMKQMGVWVFGVEINVDSASIDGSSSNCLNIATLAPGISSNCETNVNWMVTGLGRIGYAFNNAQVSFTSGWAIAGVDHRLSLGAGPFGLNSAKQDVADGLALGGGFELALGNNMMFGVQYLHVDLESRGEGLLLGGLITTGRRDLDLNVV